jgi:hypothetical protein
VIHDEFKGLTKEQIAEKCKRRKQKQEDKKPHRAGEVSERYSLFNSDNYRSYDFTIENEGKNEVSNAVSTTSSDKKNLPKKEQYKKQVIVDKTGVYDY